MSEDITIRPLVRDNLGTVRFKENAIIRWLCDTGRISLNQISAHRDEFPVADVEEFWQMLGYSVGGYADLDFVRPESIDAAFEDMDRILHPSDYLSGAMGDPLGR